MKEFLEEIIATLIAIILSLIFMCLITCYVNTIHSIAMTKKEQQNITIVINDKIDILMDKIDNLQSEFEK